MKKFFVIFLLALFLVGISFFGIQLFEQYRSQKGALQVTSAPASKVYISDAYIGQTPLCKCEASDMLKTGDYTIRLVPEDKSLSPFQEKITIAHAVLTVVDRKFAKDSLSSGSVISLTPLADKKKTELLVVSFPEKSTVLLDNTTIGQTPLSFKDPTESDHVLTVKKNGYEEKKVRIRTPLGYKLTVVVYLSTREDLATDATASASVETSLTPSPSNGQTVTILATPTGFLRVRDSIGGEEIARVNPGETYQLIEEQDGWFAIKLRDGKTGWISSQYAKK